MLFVYSLILTQKSLMMGIPLFAALNNMTKLVENSCLLYEQSIFTDYLVGLKIARNLRKCVLAYRTPSPQHLGRPLHSDSEFHNQKLLSALEVCTAPISKARTFWKHYSIDDKFTINSNQLTIKWIN